MLIPVFCNKSGNVTGTPTRSISFTAASSQYLSMSDANFGAFNRAKFAVNCWVKNASIPSLAPIIAQVSPEVAFRLYLQNSGGNALVDFFTSSDSATYTGKFRDGTGFSPTGWHHSLIWYDSANSTAGDRMRMWNDGVEVTSPDIDTNPSTAIFDSTGPILIGGDTSNLGYFDGLIYQLAFFSGSLPAIGTVYNAGHPMDVSGLTGLYSYLDCASGVVTHDAVLGASWTNNNTAVASSTIPT